jgi:hypothetical protein
MVPLAGKLAAPDIVKVFIGSLTWLYSMCILYTENGKESYEQARHADPTD